jgi:hypothetical protein
MVNPTAAYPMSNTPLTLASGTVIHVRNRIVFRGTNAHTLTLYIETPTEAADSARVLGEARELAEIHSEYARTQGVDAIHIGVCRTQACLETREVPTELFRFIRAMDGSWQLAVARDR